MNLPDLKWMVALRKLGLQRVVVHADGSMEISFDGTDFLPSLSKPGAGLKAWLPEKQLELGLDRTKRLADEIPGGDDFAIEHNAELAREAERQELENALLHSSE